MVEMSNLFQSQNVNDIIKINASENKNITLENLSNRKKVVKLPARQPILILDKSNVFMNESLSCKLNNLSCKLNNCPGKLICCIAK